jgi:thiamine transport system ATP-binding protein
VVRDVTLTVPRGRALAVLGPSGSGKSSLLHAVAGLVPAATGTVMVDATDVAGVPPERRGVGLMFQEFALFPHLDVAANVSFGPRMHGVAEDERDAQAAALLLRVGLDGLGPRDVATLSGGQRQRVALARALATDPAVLLLDEPFGALDRQLREQLLGEVLQLVGGDGGPAVVAVTHDRDEAFTLGDEVVVLREGRVAQQGTPDQLWSSPVDGWVARFLGQPNVLAPEAAASLRLPGAGAAGVDEVLVPLDAVRPGEDDLVGDVVAMAWRTGTIRVTVAVDGVRLELDVPPGDAPRLGGSLGVALDRGRVRWLPSGSDPAPERGTA